MTPFPTKSSTPVQNGPANNNGSNNTTAANAAASASTNQRYRYQSEIQAMMYTFGDVRHPLPATTLLIEDIVHSQIIELVKYSFKNDFFIF